MFKRIGAKVISENNQTSLYQTGCNILFTFFIGILYLGMFGLDW